MEKIIFVLNNKDIHHVYSAMAFVSFEISLLIEESSVHSFINDIGQFNAADFHKLNKRIQNPANEQIQMNEKHVIIFYSVVHFACSVFMNPKELGLIQEHLYKKHTGYTVLNDADLKQKVIDFATVVSQKFRKDFKYIKNFRAVSEKLFVD